MPWPPCGSCRWNGRRLVDVRNVHALAITRKGPVVEGALDAISDNLAPDGEIRSKVRTMGVQDSSSLLAACGAEDRKLATKRHYVFHLPRSQLIAIQESIPAVRIGELVRLEASGAALGVLRWRGSEPYPFGKPGNGRAKESGQSVERCHGDGGDSAGSRRQGRGSESCNEGRQGHGRQGHQASPLKLGGVLRLHAGVERSGRRLFLDWPIPRHRCFGLELHGGLLPAG
mmetsp:Transcript_8053/g.22865  ORF Transcript_8053/g.22865 Transcript_8053/m.22865 type:complete len:229 (-) Transcript_8053:297-983(-)